ncbi:hypothetical protein AB0H57_10435 [Micromonospora sp. NPDC050686]|uniref:hypothetical protein n=1 Tax=Micromonospora sp. NPDC050686 TaxID=3154631 RepID=UPI0033D49F94
MTKSDNFFLVVAEQIDATQRNLIQHMIRTEAEDWWHESLDLWIVRGGESANDWRKRLGVFVPSAPSGIFVFKLPQAKSERSLAWRLAKGYERTKWLYEVFLEKEPPTPKPKS